MAVNVCLRVKVGQSEKSISNSFCQRTLLLIILFGTWISVDAASNTCSLVRSTFEKKHMLSVIDLQDQPNSGVDGLCYNEGCCGRNSKTKLIELSRVSFETMLKTEIMKLSTTLSSKAAKFDEFFRALFNQAKEEFHSMFKKTYGMIYEQHSYLFEDLFEHLQEYYEHGHNDVADVMDKFFGILYEKMFTVLNAQYKFDDNYLKCVGKHMRDTKPFEDVPQKLSAQLKRTFVATRTFYKALRVGSDVARSMLKVELTEECITAWARMYQCGQCGGLGTTKPCSRYCHNVVNGCLAKHADMSDDWDAYVDAVDKVADRLLGPFNIVMVVEPIDIKISEAIMHFQEHNPQISEKIFDGCGRPTLGSGQGAAPFMLGKSRRSVRSIPEYNWHKSAEANDFELDASFESVLNEDPMLLSIDSSEDIPNIVNKMKQQAVLRDKFIRYMRGEEVALDDEGRGLRNKRDAEPEAAKSASSEIAYKQYSFNAGKKKGGKKNKDKNVAQSEVLESNESAALQKIVRDCKTRVRNSRRFFEMLTYVMCSDVGSDPAPHQPCFNGTSRAPYTQHAAGFGSAALFSNPEVRPKPGNEVESLSKLAILKMITSKLTDAYNGHNVTWEDELLEDLSSSSDSMADELEERAGSGSGFWEDSNGPDDDEDFGNGSGEAPTPDYDSVKETDLESPSRPTPSVLDVPMVVPGGDDSRNVRIGSETIQIDEEDEKIEPEQGNNNKISELPSSANRVSVQKALLSYAVPVVCAWFGSMLIDLF